MKTETEFDHIKSFECLNCGATIRTNKERESQKCCDNPNLKLLAVETESIVKAEEIIKQEETKEKIGETQKRFLTWVEKFNNHIVNIDEVANYFCKKYSFVTISGRSKDNLWIFNGKFWESNARSIIKRDFEELLGKHARINPLTEIIAKIERKNYLDVSEFGKVDVNLIPLENGVYDISEKILKPHSPNYYFKTIIPVDYNSGAKCPVFLNFLSEALYLEDIPVIQEWFGFNLYRNYLIKKAVICLGERDTGKTILLDSLISFIGEQNKTGLSLQKISSGNDFQKLSLKDKLSNVYDDLSSKDLSDGGNFKIATGGGYISAEEKFGDYSQFKNYAKHTFATNKIPSVQDNDDMAYFSRWIVIRFDNPPEKKDLFLREKIEKEKSGILNWALEGLFRLLQCEEFSYKKTPEEVKQIMEMSGDTLIQFGDEVLEKSDGRVSKEKIYEIYCIWANEKDKPLLSKEQLGRRLNQKIKYLVAKNDTKERFWANVSIKPNWVTKLPECTENPKEIQNLDTFDTSRKSLRYPPVIIQPPNDIIFTKVSKVSNEDLGEFDAEEVIP